MLTLTPAARQELARCLEDRPGPRIRVFRTMGGCAGPCLALVLDERRPGDVVIECEGLVFLVERELLREVAPIRIDADFGGLLVQGADAPER